MPKQTISPAANERSGDGSPVADIGGDAFEGRLAIMNVNQVGTVEDRGSSSRDPVSDRRSAQRVLHRESDKRHSRNQKFPLWPYGESITDWKTAD